VPYENPQGRRVNVLAAYSPLGPQPALTWGYDRGSLVAGQFVDFLGKIPRLPDKPLVVVLDNGSLHRNRVVQAALPALRQQRIYLYYLPPYSPELNAIEAIFGVVKRGELPERRYPAYEPLEAAIDTGFSHVEQRLLTKTTNHLGLAA
jgi:DDE superfamily endonuclease